MNRSKTKKENEVELICIFNYGKDFVNCSNTVSFVSCPSYVLKFRFRVGKTLCRRKSLTLISGVIVVFKCIFLIKKCLGGLTCGSLSMSKVHTKTHTISKDICMSANINES